MTQKIASKSFGKEGYPCLQAWPEDTFVQCGGSGLVLGSKPYTTAFFEAFPKTPQTFIRGEGESIEKAEESCWNKYEKIMACEKHEYVRRGEEHGVCQKCGLFTSNCFPPEASCSVCGKEHVNFTISDKKYCFKDYLETVKNIDIDNIVVDKNEKKSFMVWNAKEEAHYHLKQLTEYNLLLKYDLLDLSVDYKINKLKDFLTDGYIQFSCNLVRTAFLKLKESNPTLDYWLFNKGLDEAENDLEIFTELLKWHLADKKVLDVSIDREVILQKFLSKGIDLMKDPEEDFE